MFLVFFVGRTIRKKKMTSALQSELARMVEINDKLRGLLMNAKDALGKKEDPGYVANVLQRVLSDYVDLCGEKDALTARVQELESLVSELQRATVELEDTKRSVSPLMDEITHLKFANQNLRDELNARTPMRADFLLLTQLERLRAQMLRSAQHKFETTKKRAPSSSWFGS